jgi:CheY-like chemotaxis protein
MSLSPAFDALDRQPHLLLVDDDDRIRDLLKRFLTQSGARVSAAPDAAGARKLLESMDFDLLILDVMMPVEDGFSLAESVRRTSKVPIVRFKEFLILRLLIHDAGKDKHNMMRKAILNKFMLKRQIKSPLFLILRISSRNPTFFTEKM